MFSRGCDPHHSTCFRCVRMPHSILDIPIRGVRHGKFGRGVTTVVTTYVSTVSMKLPHFPVDGRPGPSRNCCVYLYVLDCLFGRRVVLHSVSVPIQED